MVEDHLATLPRLTTQVSIAVITRRSQLPEPGDQEPTKRCRQSDSGLGSF
jgi:hypothetical protein